MKFERNLDESRVKIFPKKEFDGISQPGTSLLAYALI